MPPVEAQAARGCVWGAHLPHRARRQGRPGGRTYWGAACGSSHVQVPCAGWGKVGVGRSAEGGEEAPEGKGGAYRAFRSGLEGSGAPGPGHLLCPRKAAGAGGGGFGTLDPDVSQCARGIALSEALCCWNASELGAGAWLLQLPNSRLLHARLLTTAAGSCCALIRPPPGSVHMSSQCVHCSPESLGLGQNSSQMATVKFLWQARRNPNPGIS